MAAELMVITKPGVTKLTESALSRSVRAGFLVWAVRQRAMSAAKAAMRNARESRLMRVLIGSHARV